LAHCNFLGSKCASAEGTTTKASSATTTTAAQSQNRSCHNHCNVQKPRCTLIRKRPPAHCCWCRIAELAPPYWPPDIEWDSVRVVPFIPSVTPEACGKGKPTQQWQTAAQAEHRSRRTARGKDLARSKEMLLVTSQQQSLPNASFLHNT